jgi:hypothetical protein
MDGPRLVVPSLLLHRPPRGCCSDRQAGDLSSSGGSDLALEIACPMTKAGNPVRGLEPPHAPPSQLWDTTIIVPLVKAGGGPGRT